MNRAPVIVIMGHIDHGKSTLLDYIRKTNVVAGEAGGITQHLGAYEVTHNKQKITFLDTPGHEAFSAIRERGAAIADIAVLVVSAEEGVKTQTLEALAAIKAAGRPFVVAINKIDRPNANVERVKQSLAEHGVLVEGYGGNISWVAISAKTGAGIPELLDLLLLTAELENLTGDEKLAGTGLVLEANRDPRVGVTATLLIKNGTVNTGDWVVSGSQAIKIKKLENYLGEMIKSASFSSPVKVYGFTDIPLVGGEFTTYTDKKVAEATAANFKIKDISEVSTETTWELPLVVKADVSGSLDAVMKEIKKLNRPEAAGKIIASALGTINENDVKSAAGSKNSIILGFNVKADKNALDLAERLGLTIATFDIIYKLSEWLELELESRRPKTQVEVVSGEAKVLKIFSQTRDKQVLGGQVRTGLMNKNRDVNIVRREKIIGRGRLTDLEQAKKKVSEVADGLQFGAVVEAKITIAPGDVLQALELTTQ